MRAPLAFWVSGLLLVGCQIIGGIEVREKYRGADGAAGGADAVAGEPGSPAGGDQGEAVGGAGGATQLVGGAGGEGASSAAGAAGEAGQGPAVCGDGTPQAGEVCDDGAKNGQSGKCDATCQFVCVGACPLRVDPTLADSGDGHDWKSALSSIDAAVSAQQAAGGGEVWVKQAVVLAEAAGPLLSLRSSVAVYGGFVGTEATRAERPAPTEDSVTVLDANALAYPIVQGSGGAQLDGFKLRNGSGPGGAALSVGVATDLVVRDVWFQNNASVGANACGGALRLDGGEMAIERGRFEGNTSAGNGGAICVKGTSSLSVDGTSFADNQAVVHGGAIAGLGDYVPNTHPTLKLENATFIGNEVTDPTPASTGAAIFVQKASVDVSACDFMSNVVPFSQGAALFCDDEADCLLTNSAIVRNLSYGAAVYGTTSTLRVVNATFAFNEQNCPQACDVASASSVLLQNSVLVTDVKSQYPGTGGGVTSQNNCGLFLSGGLGSQPSPFAAVLPDRDNNGVPDYVLAQPAVNPCLDAASATFAEDVGIAWTALTTSGDNCLDAAPIDAGRHYPPSISNATTCQ